MPDEPRPDDMPYARDIVTAWMVHLGYAAEDIHLDSPDHKAFGCELNYDYGWQCDNNDDEKSRHPLHDAAEEAFQPIMFALEHLSAAGALMPAGGDKVEQWGVRPPSTHVSSSYELCFSEQQARRIANQRTGDVGRRTVTVYADGSMFTTAWETTDATR